MERAHADDAPVSAGSDEGVEGTVVSAAVDFLLLFGLTAAVAVTVAVLL